MIDKPIKAQTFKVESDLSQLAMASEKVLNFFRQLSLSSSDLFDVRLCFEESLINAVKYGGRGQTQASVKVETAFNRKEIFIAVEDSGKGFDVAMVPDPTKADRIEASSGRGVYLIQNLMDKVMYNDKGNRIEMIKCYEKEGEVKDAN